MCVLTHTAVKGQWCMYSSNTFHLSFETGFTGLELTVLARLAGRQDPGVVCFSQSGVLGLQACTWVLMFARAPNSGPYVARQALYSLSHLSSPLICSFCLCKYCLFFSSFSYCLSVLIWGRVGYRVLCSLGWPLAM